MQQLYDYTASDAELLQKVNEAITAIMVTGQSYKIGSRSVTRADLNTLRQFKAELEGRIAASEEGSLMSNTSVAFFDRR